MNQASGHVRRCRQRVMGIVATAAHMRVKRIPIRLTEPLQSGRCCRRTVAARIDDSLPIGWLEAGPNHSERGLMSSVAHVWCERDDSHLMPTKQLRRSVDVKYSIRQAR